MIATAIAAGVLVAPALAETPAAAVSAYGPLEGVASWYGAQFHGRLTANGEVYDKEKLTAAHRSLPFGTFLLVRNLDNGSSVVVRVNDRGPFAKDRVLDLSEAAARIVGMVPTGTARVALSTLPPEEALAWQGGALDGAPSAPGSPGSAATARAATSGTGAAALTGTKDDAIWRIQVASYRDEANALATQDRLRAAGLEASIEVAGAYKRVVFVGLGEDEARRVAERLGKLGYRGCTVLRSSPR